MLKKVISGKAAKSNNEYGLRFADGNGIDSSFAERLEEKKYGLQMAWNESS